MQCALINAVLLADTPEAEQEWLTGLAVIIEGGRIAAIVDEHALPASVSARVNLKGRKLVPGFFDTQVNGGGGVLLNDAPTVDSLAAIAKAHRPYGTTTMLPTLISDDLEVMEAAIAATREAIAANVPGVVGVHLEGPFLNPERKGVHNEAKFRRIDERALALLCSLDQGKTLVTLAPERTDVCTIRALADAGVVIAAGHTAGSYDDIRLALDNGLSSFTHLFNAMSPMTSREPGCVGAALEDRHSWCGVIVDGYHVHEASLRVALKSKPRGKIVLVTDAMPTVGMKDKRFELNGEMIIAENGRCATASGTLAGSDLDMITAVKNTVEQLGVSLAEAIRMASLYPAAMMDLDHEFGSITVGKRANLITLDHDLHVADMWIDGERQTL